MNKQLQVLQHLIDLGRSLEPVSVAVCHPCSEISLRGAIEAAQAKLITPVLVGPAEKIKAIALAAQLDISPYHLISTAHSHDSAAKAVELCHSAQCEIIMKGSLHTDELIHAVLDPNTGLRTDKRLSHVYLMEVSTYPKLLLVTDAAINISPTLEDKKHIVQNAIDLAHVLGIRVPKVAILSAVETVNPKILSTLAGC